MPEVVRQGAYWGALAGQRILALRTPRYTGTSAARWRAHRGTTKRELAEIHNDAPHIGIVEEGARPHPVSKDGVEALTRWARLKLGLDPESAKKVANAIAWRLRKKGQKPTYFVRDSKPDLTNAAAQNIAHAISEYSKRRLT